MDPELKQEPEREKRKKFVSGARLGKITIAQIWAVLWIRIRMGQEPLPKPGPEPLLRILIRWIRKMIFVENLNTKNLKLSSVMYVD